MNNKILLVEDDEILKELLEEFLTSKGFSIISTPSYEEALSLAYEKNFDLWILDVKILGGNGFELLKELRELNFKTPAIFTTSLNDLASLKTAFSNGCDDYLKKPFLLAELLLRIENLLKKSYQNQSEVIKIHENLKYNLLTKELFQDEKIVKLSTKEIKLLELFLKNPNKILSKEEIFEKLWDFGEEPSEMSLRVYIKNLRKVLGNERLKSRSKIGYIYE